MILVLLACALPELDFNEPPIAGTVEIAPNRPRSDDTIVRLWTPGVDPEGGVLEHELAWFQNGVALDVEGDSLGASRLTRGDVIGVYVTAFDGEYQTVWSITAEVENALPRINQVEFKPERPTSEDELVLLVKGYDPDGDELDFRYTWFLDDAEVQDIDLFVPAERTTRGDIWSVLVEVDDGDEEGAAVLEHVVVHNALPVVEWVRINSEVEVDKTTGAYVSGVFDNDDDPVTAWVQWRVNNVVVEEDPLWGEPWTAVLDWPLQRYDEVQARAWVDDGYGTSEIVESDVETAY